MTSRTSSRACAPTAPNWSAKWCNTRTGIGSLTSVALRALSSHWPSSSAEGFDLLLLSIHDLTEGYSNEQKDQDHRTDLAGRRHPGARRTGRRRGGLRAWRMDGAVSKCGHG